MSQTDRLYQLHQILSSARAPISRQDLQTRLETSRATLTKDLAYLTGRLGAPIEFDKAAGGYRLRANGPAGRHFHLPGLWLHESEVATILVLLRVLGEALPPELRERLTPPPSLTKAAAKDHTAALAARIEVDDPHPRGRGAAATFSALAQATLARRCARIAFDDPLHSVMLISPQKLMLREGHLVLRALDHGRREMVELSLAAIDRATVLVTPAEDEEELPDGAGPATAALPAAPRAADLPATNAATAAAAFRGRGARASGRIAGIAGDVMASFSLAFPVEVTRMAGCARQHADHVDTVLRDAPQLLPMYLLHHDALPVHAPDAAVSALRTRLLARGVRPATWRLVHHAGDALLSFVAEFYDGQPAESSIDLLGCLQLAGLRREVPGALVRTLLQLFGNFQQRRGTYLAKYEPLAPALRRVAHLFEAADADTRARIDQDLYAVLRWLTLDKSAPGHPHAPRAAWPWFKRRMTAWREAETIAAQDGGRTWRVPFTHREVDGVSVRCMSSRLDVLQQARAMKHCGVKFNGVCATGEALMLALHLPGLDVRATALLMRSRSWGVHMVAGPANTRADVRCDLAARRVAAELSSQGPVARGSCGAELPAPTL